MIGGSDFCLETRVIIKISTHPWYPRNFDQFSWVGHFGFFFASSPWKLVKLSWVSRMGRNFDDYPGFQPKISPPKHFSRQCSSEDNCLDFRMVGVCTAQIPLEKYKGQEISEEFFLVFKYSKNKRNFLQISAIAVFEEEKKIFWETFNKARKSRDT